MTRTLFTDAVLTGETLEYLRLPDDVAGVELVKGRLEVVPQTSAEHAALVTKLCMSLRREGWRVLAGDLGLYTKRHPDTVRRPDVIMISETRYAQRDPQRASLTVGPELVIEVLAPADLPEEMERKAHEYAGVGCDWSWIVDPKRQEVAIIERREFGVLAQVRSWGELLPLPDGTTIAVADLFQ